MLCFLLDRARKLGLGEAVADVFATNHRAKEFLRHHGFVPRSGYAEASLGVWVRRMTRPVTLNRAYELSLLTPGKLRDVSDDDLRLQALRLRAWHRKARERAERRAILHERYPDQPAGLLDAMAVAGWREVHGIEFHPDGRGAIMKGDHPSGDGRTLWIAVDADGTSREIFPRADYVRR